MRKNIIFITADQLGASSVGCYGSGVNSTPTLDRLAKEGVRFDRAYAHVPVCAPNRATFMTGRSSGVHGLTVNNLTLSADHPTYPMVLREAGYRIGGFGKFHLTPMQENLPANFNHLGFDESIPTEDPKLGPWLDWVEQEHPEYYDVALAVSWPLPCSRKYGAEQKNIMEMMKERRERILKPVSDASDWRLMYTSPLPAEIHQTTYITDCGLDFMERHIDKHSDAPFMCFVSYVDPHDPYDPPAPYDSMFNPEDMPDPIPESEDGHISKTLDDSRKFCDFKNISNDVSALRKLKAYYHGSVKFVDDQISRIVDFLKQNELLDDTIILFTTDHGEMLGDHGLITKGVKHYDSGIRVPLIVRGAGVSNLECKRLTTSLDLFSTFCDWADVSEPPPLEGKSLAPACRGEDSPEWNVITVESPPERGRQMVRSIITGDYWRFSVFLGEEYGEMFNLRDDPNEKDNLYFDEKWMKKRVELHKILTEAYMEPYFTCQYPNLPVVDGIVSMPNGDLGPLLHLRRSTQKTGASS